MARKEIKNPMDDNSLNNTNHNFTELYSGFRDTSGKINKVEKDINDRMDNFIDETSDAAFDKVVDSARLNWDTMVEKYSDLPSDAETGTTIGVKEDSLVYRYDGSKWVDIYEINLNPISEVDDRLSSQLAETEQQRFYESMIDRKRPKPMITWVDDDGRVGFYNKLKPLAEEYGIVFTSAIITKNFDRGGNYLSLEQMKEMQELGCEFVSHTHNHDVNNRPDQMTEEELREDYSISREIMRKNGFNYRGIVMPFGTYTKRETDIARDYFYYAVGTSTRGDNIIMPPVNNYDLLRTNAQLGVDKVKAQIDRAKENNAWLILTTHVDAGDWYSEEYAREIIEYALQQGLEFVTTEEGINAHGNIAQFGSNSISADGQIFGNELGRVVIDNSTSIDAYTPIDYFKEGAITHSRISGHRGGFPHDESGTLETYRVLTTSTSLWEYQIFTTTRSKRVYYRSLDEDSREWLDWVLQGLTQYLPTNTVTIDMLPTDESLKKKITYSAVNREGNDNFPRSKSGMLITYAQQTDSFAYQEYHIFRSGQIYKRWFDSVDKKWLDWQPDNNMTLLDINEFNSDNKIEDFDFGITLFSCNSANGGSSLPNDTGGTFTVYYTNENELGWNYQEFVEYKSTNKYIRNALENGNWSSWKKFVVELV